jgi:ATP-dependent DNA ligase
MEALLVDEIPSGPNWQYEPKWDGFRCIAFRHGKSIELQSKAGQPLARYFPEIVGDLAQAKSHDFVLDGEIVIPVRGRLSFDDLLMRIHPAASRVWKLSEETPALYILFDLLQEGAVVYLQEPLSERRRRLEAFVKSGLKGTSRCLLSPATHDIKLAKRWFSSAGSSLDGIIAKRADLEYRSKDRTGMQKIKPLRTADCVVGGFRYAAKKRVVGSLLLGLYDDEGKLNHVGFSANIKHSEQKALTGKLEKLVKPPGFTGSAPGGPSRWSTKRSGEWEPLKPSLVAEVEYDHFTGGRFRHGTKFLRWRPDKAPRQCRLDQVSRHQGPLQLLKLSPRAR